MKKNGYLRKFIAMFLVFVMLMADSSMTTFADVVGREVQQNADEENGIDLQSADDGKLAAGKYGNYTLSYNGTKNAFTADTKYANYYNTQSPLGVAGSFHIVAFDTARLNAHTNGNILANTLIAGSNFGTNNYPDELSYAVRYQQVNSTSASSSSHTLVVGSNNTIAAVDNNNVLSVNGTKIDKPQNLIVDNDSTATPFIDLTDVKNEITNKSAALARVANTAVTANFSDQNNRSLTLTNPDYAGYYNMTAAELNALSGNPLKMMGFKSGHDGSIIVNVDCSGVTEVNMPQKACVYIDGNEQSTDEVTTFENGKVIWNFVNATGVKINTQQMTGMVIAPGATVNVNQNLNGTVVAENVNVNAESHRTDFTGVTTPAEVEADGTKTVDGKEPTSTQKFDFELAESTVTFNNENEALASDQWKSVETVQNEGSKINFSNLNYSKDSDIGTHWYKVSEKSDVSNTSYTYDNTVYLMKVVVTKTNNVFNADKTYYRVENNQASSTDKIQFNNTTVQQKGDLKIVKAASTGTDLDGKTFFFKVTDINGNIVKNGESDVWSITYGAEAENSVTITDLEPGNYSVVETDQNGNEVTTDDSFPYTVSGNGNVKFEAKNTVFITVTNTKKMVSVSGSKTWNVPEGTTLPESITVILKQNDEVYDTKTVTAADDWNYSFTDLDKYDADGNEYTYSVDEEAVAGYNKAVDGFNITNTKSDKIDVSGSKTWNAPEGTTLPDSITVILNQNGKEYDTKTVTAADGWKYEWKDLPLYSADGKTTYTYSIDEEDVEGYNKTVDGNDLINTITGKTEVSGTKTWKAPEGTTLPESITVILNQNGKEYDTKTVTAADGWKYEWKDLPLYSADGKTTYTYSIDEKDVEGYNKTVDGNDLINTITGKTKVEGIKTWNDSDNQDGIRPDSITVNLFANGVKVKSQEVTAANDWKYTFDDLDKYENGKEIIYTVSEDLVKGYTASVNDYDITNTHKAETTEISGSKSWNDGDNQDGIRPDTITVNLFADGTKVKSQEVTPDENGNWTYSFTDLPKYADGKKITYTVTEEAVEGYETTVNGYNILNTHKPETISIDGTKHWDDANNQDGKRPESITVNLLANGVKVASKKVTAKDNWKYVFNDLPVYEKGKVGQKLTYTVSEDTVEDYTTEIDGTDITNSYTPGKVGVSVTKIWDDAENQDGIRPTSITVKLFADGQDTGKTVILDENNEWTQSITGLDEKKDGNAIKYTWAEENVSEGYELTGNTTEGTVTTLTNKHVPKVTSISGTKTWNDNNNQDGKRPSSITVNLLADGNVYASKTVTAATKWQYTFDNLPVYKNGTEIAYTIGEVEVKDYTTEVDGYDIINTHTTETTSVEGEKVWDDANNQDGKRPESIKVRLLANGTEVAAKDVTAKDDWKYSFTELPKFAEGKEIVYTVTEDKVADYTTTINGTTITNSYKPGKTSITVTKAWVDNDDQDGIRPDSIKVQLYAGDTAQGKEVTLSADNDWTYTWSKLDAKKDGQDIAYTVKEVGDVTGYISEVSGDAEKGFVITNTHTTETTSVEGKKVWDDANNQDGKRPESIKVRLLANGTEVAEKDVTAADDWTYSFTDLPKFADGKEIIYTVTEDTVTDYTTVIDGTTITNSYTPGKTSITVTKAWADNDNQDGIRPDSIKVQLCADDTAQGKEVTLSEDNNWTYTWSELDAKKDGQDIVYTVRETEVPAGYKVTVAGSATEGFILTNTHEAEVISVEGTKT